LTVFAFGDGERSKWALGSRWIFNANGSAIYTTGLLVPSGVGSGTSWKSGVGIADSQLSWSASGWWSEWIIDFLARITASGRNEFWVLSISTNRSVGSVGTLSN